ncbi:MAG: Hsp33 family molecular chaperone HslO [Alphaproteobacteria bacterium]
MSQIIDLSQPVYTDSLLQFIIGNNVARGRIVRLKKSYKQALASHHYTHRINEILGHVAALGLMLTSSVKEDGIFTLQLQRQDENRPIRLMVAEMDAQNNFRLTARYDEDIAIKNDASIEELFGKDAIMAFTTDYDKGERYQGLAALDKEDLALAAMDWLNNSDQVESIVSLRSAIDEHEQGELAFGLIIQPLATQDLSLEEQGEHQEIWENISIFAQSLKDEEALDEDLALQDLLFRLFHEFGVKITQGSEVKFQCRCSKEKFISALQSMENIEELADDGIIKTKCEYCGQQYDISLKGLTSE